MAAGCCSQVFRDESQPVIDMLRETGRVAEIDSQSDAEGVFALVEPLMDEMQEKGGSCARVVQDGLGASARMPLPRPPHPFWMRPSHSMQRAPPPVRKEAASAPPLIA